MEGEKLFANTGTKTRSYCMWFILISILNNTKVEILFIFLVFIFVLHL